MVMEPWLALCGIRSSAILSDEPLLWQYSRESSTPPFHFPAIHPHTMLQLARRTGGKAAVAAGAAVVALSGEDASECRASQTLDMPMPNEVQVLSAKDIQAASAMMKDTVVTMSQEPF